MTDRWADLREWLEALRDEAADVPNDPFLDILPDAFANPLLGRLMEEQLVDLGVEGPFTEPLPGRCTMEQLSERVGEDRWDAFIASAKDEAQRLSDRVDRRERLQGSLPRRSNIDVPGQQADGA